MMSNKKPFKLPQQYGIERDVLINSSNLINLYAVPAKDTTSGISLLSASGFENPSAPLGNGNIRQQFVFRDIQYLVAGSDIYSRDSLGATAFLGSISNSSGYVGVTANANQIIFVNGANGYIYDTVTAVFTTIVFGFPISPTDVTMIDGYFVVIDGGKREFYTSALNNGLVWNVLDNGVFQSKPDQLVAVFALKRRIYFFGTISIETWYDAGASPGIPLRRDNNGLFEHGCVSPSTIQEGFEVMLYLSSNNRGSAGVMLAEGSAFPKKVSTPQIDYFLQNLTDIQSADAILYKENGFTFYQLSFTTENKTLVYVIETNLWHVLETPNGDRHPAISHSFAYNKHWIGVNTNNSLYEMADRFFTYGGELIRSFIISEPFFAQSNNRIRVDNFYLEMAAGMPQIGYAKQHANPSADEVIIDNTEPYLILFVSRDGGRTYGNGRTAGFGKYGDYNRVVSWHRLGVYKGRRIVFKIEFPFKLPYIVIGAYICSQELLQ